MMHTKLGATLASAALALLLAWPTAANGQAGGQSAVPVLHAANQVQSSVAADPLLRPVNLDAVNMRLADALSEISNQAGFRLIYGNNVVPVDQRITARFSATPAGKVLQSLLAKTDVDFKVGQNQHVILVKRPPPPPPVPPVQQTGTVTGRVTAAANGQPLAAATVVLEGTNISAVTDAEGRYRLGPVASGTYRVTVRLIGYATLTQTIEVRTSQASTLDFVLAMDAIGLEELVVTATGEQRRVEIGNSIGKITAESVVGSAPITSLSDLLNARVSGVQVMGVNGMTGTSPTIRIRGVNSVSLSNAPLFIVDGVRINNQTSVSQSWVDPRAGFGQWGGRLNDLNPEEIESLEIVKGPSAATLYGTDAANGVVVITTKRGRLGAPAWTTYAEVGMLEPAQRFLDNYHSWGHDAAGNIRQCKLLESASGACTIDSLSVANQLQDPETSPIGKGYRRQFGAQVRGGVERFTYFVAGEHERETGYFRLPAAEEARLKAERGVSSIPAEQIRPNWIEKLSFRANTGVNLGSADLTLSQGLVIGESQVPSPSDLTFGGEFGQGYKNPATNGGWFFGERPGETFSIRNTEKYTRYTGSLSGNWRPVTWLDTRFVFGLDLANSGLDALQRNGEGIPYGAMGRRQNTRGTTALYSIDLGASARFDLHSGLTSRTSIGVQYNETADQLTSLSATTLPPGAESVRGASQLTGTELNNQTIVAGAYLEEMLGINDRLFITGAIRLDGGSSFGQDFKTAVYPKASVSWLALNRGPEGSLNNLRLRAAFGTSGVQPGATDALTLYEVFTAFVNDANTSAARPDRIGNKGLKPERQTEFEIGADLTLYGGRISFEGTYYNRLSRDALVRRPLSPDVGVTSRWENIGAVRNSGIEGSLHLQAIETPRYGLDVSVNGSINHSKLEKMGSLAARPAGLSTFALVEGFPLYGYWDYPILGYEDANGNGIIEPDEVSYGDKVEFLGTSIPPHQVTIATGVDLFGRMIRISSLFDYRGGVVSMNSNFNRCTGFIANCREINDPSTPLSQQARMVGTLAANYSGIYTGIIEDASFTRWRELSATLNLPDRIAGRIGVGRAALTLTGRNLALFTKYSGKDPEAQSGPGVPGNEGFSDGLIVPQSRYWILRLTLGF